MEPTTKDPIDDYTEVIAQKCCSKQAKNNHGVCVHGCACLRVCVVAARGTINHRCGGSNKRRSEQIGNKIMNSKDV